MYGLSLVLAKGIGGQGATAQCHSRGGAVQLIAMVRKLPSGSKR